MNNWILVSERLPEEDKNVLVTYLGYNDNKPYCGVAYMENGKWLWSSDDDEVIVKIIAWQYVEPYKIIKLANDEKTLLKVTYNQGYRWIVRDENNHLYIFKEAPNKGMRIWTSYTECGLEIFEEMFVFIKWEDEEPYSIEELLKEC